MAEKRNGGTMVKELAEKDKEARELRAALAAAQAELNAKRKRPAGRPDVPVWAKHLSNHLSAQDKVRFVRECREQIKACFLFSDKEVRKSKSLQWTAVATQARNAFEKWAFDVTGFEWKVRGITPIKYVTGNENVVGKLNHVPEKDQLHIEWGHFGYIESKIGNPRNVADSLTPDGKEIKMFTTINRFDLDNA